MKVKIKPIKPGDIKKLFEERRTVLLERLKRLETRQKEGWGYRKFFREGYKVGGYKVDAHWVTLPVKVKK